MALEADFALLKHPKKRLVLLAFMARPAVSSARGSRAFGAVPLRGAGRIKGNPLTKRPFVWPIVRPRSRPAAGVGAVQECGRRWRHAGARLCALGVAGGDQGRSGDPVVGDARCPAGPDHRATDSIATGVARGGASVTGLVPRAWETRIRGHHSPDMRGMSTLPPGMQRTAGSSVVARARWPPG
jgi:hypothetical protein